MVAAIVERRRRGGVAYQVRWRQGDRWQSRAAECVDERVGMSGTAEPADENGCTVGQPLDRFVGGGNDLSRHQTLSFSRTTARPCPTPMQMAATPQRTQPPYR